MNNPDGRKSEAIKGIFFAVNAAPNFLVLKLIKSVVLLACN